MSRSTATLAFAALFLPSLAAAQGRCGGDRAGTPSCDTSAVKAPFAPTGWKTIGLDHFSVQATDYKREAAYYMALMNWSLRSDDGTMATLDAGTVGQVIIRGGFVAPPAPAAPPAAARPAGDSAAGRGGAGGRAGGGGGARPPRRTAWDAFAWAISPWDAKKVEAELKKRGLNPVAENDGASQCFVVKDPDGFPVGICNDVRFKAHQKAKTVASSVPAPFENTAWKTAWLDHISFQATNYKESAAFYQNLLGWKPTGDEGSQNEMEIGEDVGNIIVRGGNPLAPNYTAPSPRRAQMDHVSFGIAGFDPDPVKAELTKRGLNAREDTGGRGDIHDPKVSYKSYHTTTPDGFDLQISNAGKGTRTAR
jgi:predicted enzyme related to lactoylglutathione lyase